MPQCDCGGTRWQVTSGLGERRGNRWPWGAKMSMCYGVRACGCEVVTKRYPASTMVTLLSGHVKDDRKLQIEYQKRAFAELEQMRTMT